MEKTLYQYSAKTLHGENINLEQYRGKVILVVNTASKCGLTPQFEGLEALNQKYKDQGFVILGFPCNQFANQEPGDIDAIESVCMINYGVTFQIFEKIDVNGPDTHPIFQFLKEQLGGILGSNIKWNFTKFLINTTGKPVKRFAPITKPKKLEKAIEKFLKR